MTSAPPPSRSGDGTALDDVLERSRALGFLGPGPVEPQRRHAAAFLPSLVGCARVLDLGSGGGLPGLALAVRLDDVEFALLDGNVRRCRFLTDAVEELGLAERVQVLLGRAEELARQPELRGVFDAVVARSFGPPAVTAECAAGFLSGPGARLLVSEPPEGSANRWPVDGLALLGMEPGAVRHDPSLDATIQQIEVVAPCPENLPRRVGIPTKRPLF
ncbi:MAG: RsmG family class I SAM-dependent methyltransferase [Microthrixaceae bacterium]